ncbi:hypothetical protein EIP91_005865 [Steccherinum ochraceum]|uniref:Uncharacterized protein n=1 Tax=Steccherinum ochraceum TaxID=92696 RepID=A0A4R0RHH8_9APHY|nr:hypothetical protein EIP91_005865 [Steccherinum ochraceum]
MFFAANSAFCKLLVVVTLVATAATAHVFPRQGGGVTYDPACYTSSFKCAGSLLEAQGTARNLTSQLASNPATAADVKDLSQALDDAAEAIATLTQTVVAGTPAPESALDEINESLARAFVAASRLYS